jgi:hypothetical protein
MLNKKVFKKYIELIAVLGLHRYTFRILHFQALGHRIVAIVS